jgi:hypothetical protein
MVALFIIGGVIGLIGLIVTLTSLKSVRRRKRIMDTPTSPIAQATGQGRVEVKGRVVAGELGVLQTPFSGRHGVWVRVTVQELRSTGRSSYWATIVNETDFRPFYVEDGSGQRARVMPQGAEMILDSQNISNSGTFNDPPPHLQAFLAARGLSTTSFLGFNKRIRYDEQVLVVGDALYALGPSQREPGPPVSDGYRMVPGSQLVMFAGQGEDFELILTNKNEDQLVSKLLWGFVGGLITLGIGGLLMLAGMVAGLAGAL